MTVHVSSSRETGDLVLAFHCGGGSPRQWSVLAEKLSSAGFSFKAPQLPNVARPLSPGPDIPFSLALEASPYVRKLEEHGKSAHLVGHSYGGAVALHIAVSRPDLVASLTLYEPSAFHLLPEIGVDGKRALCELSTLAECGKLAIRSKEPKEAARLFVTYWGGDEAWEHMSEHAIQSVCEYLPKGHLEFVAARDENRKGASYANLLVPVAILRGSADHNPARMSGDFLAETIPNCRQITISAAGHMGPLTHATDVAEAIADYIETVRLTAPREVLLHDATTEAFQ